MMKRVALIAAVLLIIYFGWYMQDLQREKFSKISQDIRVDIKKVNAKVDVEEHINDRRDEMEYSNDKPKNRNIISINEVKSIALKLVNGEIINYRLQDDGRLIYKVEVELDGVEHVVKVNAYTGEVIAHEVD